MRGITARLGVTLAVALAAAALAANAYGMTPETAYNNLNTVAKTVNGMPNEDTYSQDYEGFPFGGQVETADTNSRLIKSLNTQLDVFACESGTYSGTCTTKHTNKKFSEEWTASVYQVGAGNELGAKIAESSATLRLRYRPSTNASCPETSEGKGFGSNCDVGGLLQQVTFKKFTQTAPLSSKAIILLNCKGCEAAPVNVGLQTSFKGFSGGEYISEPPAEGGKPATGSDPLPEDVYYGGKLQSGWAEFQPVFELITK